MEEGHVECIGENIYAYTVMEGKPEAKDALDDLSVDGKIILKYIFRTQNIWAITLKEGKILVKKHVT
jgi:hypothetical protein